MSNPCIRCGKPRIDGESWERKIGISVITCTKTICPDPACQKILDEMIADRIAKNNLMIENKAKAKLAREKAVATA